MHRAGRLDERHVYDFADARKFEETAVALLLTDGAPRSIWSSARCSTITPTWS